MNAKLRQNESDLRPVLQWLTARQPEMVDCLRELVLRESPTHDKLACDTLCSHLVAEMGTRGGKVKVHRQDVAGDHLECRFDGDPARRPVLLLGHLDTVYDVGTLKTMPWREEHGRLYGPGIFDMKSGIAQMLFAIAALRAIRGDLPRPVKILLVSDEEEGSATSRAITERLALECCAVLVCEPSGPGGALKTARKGVGNFTLRISGVAAHSGLDFEKGHSAVIELAHQVLAIAKLTDLQRGITLNAGVVRGGTRTNVIPAEAVAEIDLRIAHKEDGAVMEQKIMGLRAVDPQCKLEIEGGINRPPMERTEQVAALFQLAREIAKGLGFGVEEIAVGGGSDGNFTAGIGVPTLDGLGGVGEGAHAAHESVLADELPRRAALVAGLLEAIP